MDGRRQRRKINKPEILTTQLLEELNARRVPADFDPDECSRCGRPLEADKYHVFWEEDTPRAQCWPCHKLYSL